MQATCSTCKATHEFDDARVPDGHVLVLKCPLCGSLMRAARPGDEDGPEHVGPDPRGAMMFGAPQPKQPTTKVRDHQVLFFGSPAAPSPLMTSDSHPIRVDWLLGQTTPGKVGLTLAPGKHSHSKYAGGRWQRDLEKDLRELSARWKAQVLVCLLEDQDLVDLGIANLVEAAARHRLEVLRLPIADGSVPSDVGAVRALVDTLRARVTSGKNVVVHCEGGLGRAGTVGGCYLTTLGHAPDEVLRMLVESRGSAHCPETEDQRQFIRDFARRRP